MFAPSRFLDQRADPFALIPQGGGDAFSGHRCAGERLTVEVMLLALGWLMFGVRYQVPIQDLDVSSARIPAMPRSGFVISDVVPADTLRLPPLREAHA